MQSSRPLRVVDSLGALFGAQSLDTTSTFHGPKGEQNCGRMRLTKMRRPLLFLAFAAIALLPACSGFDVLKPTVIQARDTERLSLAAEALLREDGYTVKRGLLKERPFGPVVEGGVELRAEKDDASFLKAAYHHSWAGAIGSMLGDHSSATRRSELVLSLIPTAEGHELRLNARFEKKDDKGVWSDDSIPMEYDVKTFGRRLQRAYGPEAKMANGMPAPPLRPAAAAAPAASPAPPVPTPLPTRTPSSGSRSNMLFGPPR